MKDDSDIQSLLGNLHASLKRYGLTVATAESCTGGLVASLLTEIGGSSEYFIGGIVAYANTVKTDLLKVPQELLDQYGAVSSECALYMAQSVRRALGADIGISITGVAGPTGGTEQKPVGTVWLGWSSDRQSGTKLLSFVGNRATIRKSSAASALNLILQLCGV